MVSPGQARYSNSPLDRQMVGVPSPVINVPIRKATPPHRQHHPLHHHHGSSPVAQQHHPLRSNYAGISPVKSRMGTPSPSPADRHERRDAPPERRPFETDIATTNTNSYELECDYDTSATVLYELLESSSWEKARSRCRTHPDEIRTWIIRRDKNHQVRWKLLPLHAAIIFQSPSFVVSALLERYPAAASRKDDQGMLPLHLAFRHKQDDEELLELLLMQYPKAVLLRDRRDRVPLEHGRDSRFSAKLMRLYAEAMSTAARGLPGMGDGNNNKHATPGGDTHTTHTESLTLTQNTVSIAQLKRLEAESEAKIAVVRADYEFQIKSMKGQYEDRIENLKAESQNLVRESEMKADSQRQALIIQHKEELDELRDFTTRQGQKDRAITDALETEIQHLQSSLQTAKDDSEAMATRYHQIVADNDQLREFLQRISEDQIQLQDMAKKHQEHLSSARILRTELVHSLLKQEDKDDENSLVKGNKIIEHASNVHRRIHEFLELRVPTNHHHILHHTDHHRNESPKNSSLHRNTHADIKKGPSRVEVERGEGDRVYSQDTGQNDVEAFYEQGVAEVGNANNGDPEEYAEVNKGSGGDNFGDVRILGDDISAITENSGY